MADESINSSPRKLNNSIHKLRLHRRQKRLNATFTKVAESVCKNEVEEEDLSCTLLVMYDSDEPMEDTIKEKPWPKVNISYDPFAEHRLLVLADRSKELPCSSRHLKATQGFEPCNNFMFELPEPPGNKVCKTDAFEITDSELLQLCEETEKKTINLSCGKEEKLDIDKSPKTPRTKRETKSIVDLILEDFCSSPQSPELHQSSEESNFNFRFANKPLKTYSRRKSENVIASQNIAEQYTQHTNSVGHFEINDDLLSNDSSTDLSVQEDQAHLIPVQEEIVVLQHSQNLCENLQNLSAYFTQLGEVEEGNKRQDTCKEFIDHQSKENSIDVKYFEEKSSSDNFFTATKAEDGCMQFEGELVLSETEEPSRNSPNEYISNEEEFIGFSSEEDDASVDFQFVPKQNCDTLTPKVDTNNDEQNDEWYDECDIFAKFDMGIAVDAASSFKVDKVETYEYVDAYKSAQINAEPVTGFRTASNKAVKISAEAQARATSILQNLPPLPINSSYDEELPMEDVEAEDCTNIMNRTIVICKTTTNDDLIDTSAQPEALPNAAKIKTNELPSFGGFTTASRKTITISDEAKHQAARIFEPLTPLPQGEVCIMNDAASTSKELLIGFRTASSKPINISKEAQARALKILEQLPEDGMEEDQLDKNKFAGFRTASRKTIQTTDEAKKRAALILEDLHEFQEEKNEDEFKESLENIQFSEWPVEEEYQMNVDERVTNGNIVKKCNISLPGFATASKKTIVISETAKQKAAAILESLPELPVGDNLIVENIKHNAETKTLNNLLIPECSLDQVNEDLVVKTDTTLIGLHKRKRSDSESAQNPRTLSSPPHTSKFACKSTNGPRSPLAHIQTTVTHSSLSELAVKTPPDYRARHGIIACKNLLSLNKSNKMNAKSIQSTKEPKVDSNLLVTPTKRSSTTIANEPKSPPATPIPNLHEFFTSATISTSTPQPSTRAHSHMRTRARKRAELVAAALSTPTTDISTTTATRITTPSNDSSFKRIDWGNDSMNKSATSLNASRLSNTSCSNITKLETNPTPKQRIARLRMYGKPPSVSPICMSSTNNCRISGLKRRTRSANKSDHIEQL